MVLEAVSGDDEEGRKRKRLQEWYNIYNAKDGNFPIYGEVEANASDRYKHFLGDKFFDTVAYKKRKIGIAKQSSSLV